MGRSIGVGFEIFLLFFLFIFHRFLFLFSQGKGGGTGVGGGGARNPITPWLAGEFMHTFAKFGGNSGGEGFLFILFKIDKYAL